MAPCQRYREYVGHNPSLYRLGEERADLMVQQPRVWPGLYRVFGASETVRAHSCAGRVRTFKFVGGRRLGGRRPAARLYFKSEHVPDQ